MSAAYGLGRLSAAIDHCSFDSLPLSYSSTSSSLSYSLQLTLSDPKDLNLRIHEILHDNAAVFNSPSPSSSSSLRSPTESLSMPIKLSCSSSTFTLRAKPDWLMVISVIISFKSQAFEMKGEQSMIIGSTLFLETNPFYATEPQEPRQRRIPLFQHVIFLIYSFVFILHCCYLLPLDFSISLRRTSSLCKAQSQSQRISLSSEHI